jgi:hypothetical protein
MCVHVYVYTCVRVPCVYMYLCIHVYVCHVSFLQCMRASSDRVVKLVSYRSKCLRICVFRVWLTKKHKHQRKNRHIRPHCLKQSHVDCMHLHAYIYIHLHTYIYIHTSISLYVLLACIVACVCIYKNVFHVSLYA